ncbi:MAG TPA: MFS transporter [Saprospiraceae bacterium]|nr:MFS transporter [Saprospiraceae bacterium]
MTEQSFAPSQNKPTLSFWQIWNMSFGFLGIQFGWGLQLGNMSAIYEYLGAQPDEIPLLWLAAPMTGLIVQPIVGYFSDRTWNKLGRRKPYFLTGALLASTALILMPHSSVLWMAAGLLWILDASINISMEPFRAFVGDMLPKEQVTRGFTMQSFFIGVGALLAAVLPWLLTETFGMEKVMPDGSVPTFLKVAFAIGGVSYLAAVLWTVRTTKEYAPGDMEAFHKMKAEMGGISHMFKEIISNIRHMPGVMKQLAVVQFFTWIGLFLMWFYFTTSVATDVLGAPNPQSELYAEGVAWGNICFGFYSIVTFIFAFVIPGLARRFGKKYVHAICLVAGFLGLMSIGLVPNKYWLLLSMVGVGIAWTSILSMPYSILAPKLPPEKMGIYMGIFNFFIVIPEIMATLFFGFVMNQWLDNDRMSAVMLGGCMLFMAAIAVMFVDDKT